LEVKTSSSVADALSIVIVCLILVCLMVVFPLKPEREWSDEVQEE
jgi:hypothetical protein